MVLHPVDSEFMRKKETNINKYFSKYERYRVNKTSKYYKDYTLKISAQSVERLRNNSYDKFKFNQCSCLGAVWRKLSRQWTTRYPKEHTQQISAQSVV